MTVRKMFPLAVALGLWTAGESIAEPKTTPTKPAPAAESKVDNQKLADAVAAKLKASGVIKGARVGIETRGSILILSGTVTSQKQHEDILRAVTEVKGITRIESEIQAPLPTPPGGVPVAAPATKAAPVSSSNVIRSSAEIEQVQGPGPGPAPMLMQPPGPMPGGPGSAMVAQDPVPLNGMPAMAALDPTGPRLPPNAWPTYAPYNNMSRVAYPASYPYNAFPYIGPFYPFPKVPLGWRKVVLEWDDGHWYLGRLQTPHDHWRVKFW
ncbi:BON domain-containing protein [Zavarzinella formosa]|uniref:BON domain-containing protein n=1 Tax=Zavarzinella formosa TaxID=360055 RepID=UPI000300FE54|nr:BON domain-containing protein [Zavarzinella formosa]